MSVGRRVKFRSASELDVLNKVTWRNIFMETTNSTFKGKVFFQTKFSNIAFEPIEIFPPFSGVAKAVIESSSERVLLEVEISSANTRNSAIAKAKEVADYIAKLLTFEFCEFHQEFRVINDSLVEEIRLPDGNTKNVICLTGGMDQRGNIEIWQKLNRVRTEELKDLLERGYPHSYNYDFFYFAVGLEEPISKFMCLYNIMLSLCKDRQKQVDKFIRDIQPGVELSPSPRKPKDEEERETVYTRLRNEIAHSRPGTTIQATREEIENNLNEFIKLTKEIIARRALGADGDR